MAAERRLDVALAERGLARSRSHAAAVIAEGLVTVDGRPAVRPALKVGDDQRIEVAGADHYVSRGAHKLIAALDAFGIDPAGRVALDAGASTGGFSQVLLERGAARVIAVDVGHGQLSPVLAGEDRLRSYEGVNVRSLTADALASLTGDDARPDLVVADLSFISLTQVLPALVATAARGADFVVLIKPQFEVGRQGIREGVVKDAGLRADAVSDVLWAAHDAGLGTAGLIASPIAGGHGNREFLAWLRSGAPDPSERREEIARLSR
ncbi:TlyA family RNA methyltransferase [Leifsonia shinshuensis]|uniref:TlyA family RNA methyltransferase n=1 Tax=Leifsonia shinshuensis TaxID=150026 RepID=UPI002866B818|nr:TlyA family RNA methyltransferase [Leifsonia shinshuensis]MDR6969727.1 23S rRNA (cytidine1920-2'-O)/16S rRNA (cytidine1409-2'-O)-methyltransferase [Leifsonia shinshuensis]